MFGPKTKTVMVVYPKGYFDVATTLKHEIAKNEKLDSTIWTIDQYKQNLPTLSGKSYVIFLGGPKDCEVARPFHKLARSIYFQKGGCFSFDGTKAMVFGMDNKEMSILWKRGQDSNLGQEFFEPQGSPIPEPFVSTPFELPPLNYDAEPEEGHVQCEGEESSMLTFVRRAQAAGRKRREAIEEYQHRLNTQPICYIEAMANEYQQSNKIFAKLDHASERKKRTEAAVTEFLAHGLRSWLEMEPEL